jgi:hypothetical protein
MIVTRLPEVEIAFADLAAQYMDSALFFNEETAVDLAEEFLDDFEKAACAHVNIVWMDLYERDCFVTAFLDVVKEKIR